MKNLVLLVLFCFLTILPINVLLGQCNCYLSPIKTEIIKVKNVSELQNALKEVIQANGKKTIILAKGEYILNTNLLFIGSNIQNLTILGETGNRDDVIIKGQGYNGNVTHIFNVAASNFYLADLTIGWVSQHPIQIHGELGAHYPIIQNVKIVDGNEQFIKISADLSNPLLTHCLGGVIECCHFEFSKGIANQYYTGGIDGHKCENWTIRNNTFMGIRSPDHNLAEHAIHFWSDSKGIVIEQNQINNCDRGIGFGLSSDTARGTKGGIIRNNFVHTNRDVGIGLENAYEVFVLHNTVWTDNYANSIEYRFANSQRITMTRNLTNRKIIARDGATASLFFNFDQARTEFFINPISYDYHLSSIAIQEIGLISPTIEGLHDIDCEERMSSTYIGADHANLNLVKNCSDEVKFYSIYNNIIILNCENCTGQIKLINLNGQVLYIRKIETNKIIFPFEFLSGIYFLDIQLNESRVFDKLFIK